MISPNQLSAIFVNLNVFEVEKRRDSDQRRPFTHIVKLTMSAATHSKEIRLYFSQGNKMCDTKPHLI